MSYVRTLAYLFLRAEVTYTVSFTGMRYVYVGLIEKLVHTSHVYVQSGLLRCVPVSAARLRIHTRLKTNKAGGKQRGRTRFCVRMPENSVPVSASTLRNGASAPWWRVRCTRFCVDNPIASLIGRKGRSDSLTVSAQARWIGAT